MALLIYDFDDVEQGAYWEREAVWNDADGNPVDLTDYAAKMQVRASHRSEEIVLELASDGDSPRITIDGDNGTLILTLYASETSAVDPGTYVYDLELTPPAPDAEKVVRLLQGSFTVAPEVTRPAPEPAP